MHLDVSRLEQFQRRLRAAARGRAGRRMDRLEASLAEAARSGGGPRGGGGDSLEDDLDADDGGVRELLGAALAASRATWTRRRRERREAPVVFKARHWRTERLHRHPPCSRTGCVYCSKRASKDLEAQMALGLRPDAGPREFWDAISKSPDAVDTDENDDADLALALPAIEMRMWKCVLLVRCHDRALGLRLNRDESQRKLLDLRLYELLVLYLRSAAAAKDDDNAPPPPSPPASPRRRLEAAGAGFA